MERCQMLCRKEESAAVGAACPMLPKVVLVMVVDVCAQLALPLKRLFAKFASE